MSDARRLRRFLIALLVAYTAKQVLTAVIFPPFTGHDEVAHYEYVRILASDGRLPALATDRLPTDLFTYRWYALQWRELGRTHAPLYTALHPPLYYAAMAPIYASARGLTAEAKQYLLRMAAIPFGLVTVWLTFLVARTVFPHDTFVPVCASSLVAFQPQVSYEAAMVNNDICAIALFTWVVYLLVAGVRDGFTTRHAVLTGTALGLALLAKGTALTALPLVALALTLSPHGGGWTRRLIMALVVGVVAASLAAPWYAHLYRTYGDFSGLSLLASFQTDLVRRDATLLQLLLSGEFAAQRWSETWGEFGWKLIPLDGWILTLTAALAWVSAAGLFSAAFVEWRESGIGLIRRIRTDGRAAGLVLLAATCVISYAAVAQFGTRFALTQARYFFPAVAAGAVVAAAGLRAWCPVRVRMEAQAALLLALILLNVTIFTAYVIPHWYFRA